MPMYDYTCANCNKELQRLTSIDERDAQVCDCGVVLHRVEVPSSVVGMSDKIWQVKAIMGDGSRVAGSFGVGRSRNRKGFM